AAGDPDRSSGDSWHEYSVSGSNGYIGLRRYSNAKLLGFGEVIPGVSTSIIRAEIGSYAARGAIAPLAIRTRICSGLIPRQRTCSRLKGAVGREFRTIRCPS